MKKLKRAYRIFIRCAMILATVLALCSASITITKISITQVRLGLIYHNIESAESARNYNASQASNSSGMLATYYQNQSNGWDEEIKTLSQKRYNIQNSDDEIISWSAKDGFELKIFAISLLGICLVAFTWFLWYRNLEKVTRVEEIAFNSIMYLFFKIVAAIFLLIGRVFLSFANVHKNKKRKKKHKNNIINLEVEADKKRRLG